MSPRASAPRYGLDPTHPAAVGFLIWLSLVNPVLEGLLHLPLRDAQLGRCNAAGDDVDEPDGATRWWASRLTVALVATGSTRATTCRSSPWVGTPFASARPFGYGVFLQLLRGDSASSPRSRPRRGDVVGFVLGDLVWDFLPLRRL